MMSVLGALARRGAWLVAVVGLGTGLGAGAFLDRSVMAADRPNIVLAIADDWSWPHAGAYGDKVVRTPAFDRVAREGVLFRQSHCASPSCTPSRGAVLTGQAAHRLENGGNLWSILPSKFAVYPDRLEAAGYAVGLTGKGWGPGTLEGSGRTRNPAGPSFPTFEAFLKSVPPGGPFCYWFGSIDPHRPYEKGAGARSGLRPDNVVVPACLPDVPEVRQDILDYYFEVERFDRAVAAILKTLDERGLAENTLVVVTSDNGMPFPRCKANLYDTGTHMPLAMRWPARLPKGTAIDVFVSHTDLAPTFLDAAGLAPLSDATGRSLLPLMLGGRDSAASLGRDAVFVERERHAQVREGNLSYPARAVRTARYLYVRNLRPDRWPAGDPRLVHSVGAFGDIDGSPSKRLVLGRRAEFREFFRAACAKRPAEELYDLEHDPGELKNVAKNPAHADALKALRARLDRWMTETGDPLAKDKGAGREPFDDYPYVGPPARRDKAPAGPSGKAKQKPARPGPAPAGAQ